MVILILVGVASGVTTAMFGFGGGFVAVPVLIWADAHLGGDAARVAVATSSVLMVVGAATATASTRRDLLAELRGSRLPLLLAAGGIVGAVAARHVPGDVIAVGFVAYLLLTIASVTVRPGFLEPVVDGARPIPAVAGLPIGAVAAFLGVGGSVVTVPMMRRAGHPMAVATALANPLTLAVALPATAVFLLSSGGRPAGAGPGFVGAVDVRAALALLVGSLPVIVVLRRRGPRLSDRAHARWYVGLLVAVTVAMAATLFR